MAKKAEVKANNKEEETKNLNVIREAAKNIRRYSYISNNIYSALKTSKKDMILKEVNILNESLNKL